MPPMPLNADDPDFINRYMRAIGQVALLTVEEETALADQVQKSDQKARDTMILANLRLVVKIAYDYANMGVPLIDLISEGNLGLIKAIERFNPRRGGRLATYAAWWIRQTVKKALADQGKMMRLPMHMVEKIAKLRRVTAVLSAKLGREPTLAELAKASRFSQRRIAQLHSLLSSTVSLETPTSANSDSSSNGNGNSSGGGTLEDMLSDEQAKTPLATLLQKANAERLNEILASMDARMAEILRLRYGLGGGAPLTLDEIGKTVGLTRERVRQLELEGQTLLKRKLMSDDLALSREEVDRLTREQGKIEVLREFMVEKGLMRKEEMKAGVKKRKTREK